MIEKNKFKKILISLLLCLLIGFTIVFLLDINQDKNKLARECNEEFLYDLMSPNEEYKINVYLFHGGPISADAIRVQLKDLKTGIVKNIYWEYPRNEAKTEWLSDKEIKINDKVLDIETDVYYKYG